MKTWKKMNLGLSYAIIFVMQNEVDYELPPKEVLEVEIGLVTKNFQNIAETAKRRFPNYHLRSDHDEERVGQRGLGERSTAAGFWNHYIGGSITLVDMELQQGNRCDKNLVREIQNSVVLLAREWLRHPNSGTSITDVNAFLLASSSFDWVESRPDLFKELEVNVNRIGDYHMLLDGEIPLRGFTPEQLDKDRELLNNENPPLNWYEGIAFPIEGIRMVLIGSKKFNALGEGKMGEQMTEWQGVAHTNDWSRIVEETESFIKLVTGFHPLRLRDFGHELSGRFEGRQIAPFHVNWMLP